MPGAIDGDAERLHPRGGCLAQRHRRVAQAVDVRAAVFAVVEVLREPVGEQDQVARTRRDRAQLADRLAQCRPHARRALRLDRTDAGAHGLVQRLVEGLHVEELDAVAPVSREAVDRVLVADLLERLRHDDQRLLLDVDDAARPRLLPGRTRGQVVGQRRGNRRGGGVGIGRRGGGRGFGLLVGRGRHVEQEERRDVALLALARGVELGRGRAARAQVAARHDDRVQVEVLAVEEAPDHPVALGLHPLELAAHLREHVGIARERTREEAAVVAVHRDLVYATPLVAIVVDEIVPLVLERHVVRAQAVARKRDAPVGRRAAAGLRLPVAAAPGEAAHEEPDRVDLLLGARDREVGALL